MKHHKQRAVLSLCLFICLSMFSACQPSEPQDATDVRTVIDFLTSPALLGRAVGTEGNVKAGEYIAKQLELLQVEPFFEDYFSPYAQTIYDPLLAAPKLTILRSGGKEVTLQFDRDYSFNLAEGEIDVELSVTHDANLLGPAQYALLANDLPIGQLKDKGFGLILTKRDTSSIAVHKLHQDAAGAALTMLNISPDYYQILESEDTTLHFSCADGKKEISSHNIIGRLKGGDSSRAFIVSAHFDGAGGSKDRFSSGAVDNVSGIAAMLHCASLLSTTDDLPFDVVFCAFNGEETALQGSNSIAKTIETEYTECVNINIDCVGQIGADIYSISEDEEQYLHSPLVAAFTAQMDQLGLKHSSSPYGGSDHRSFSCPFVVIGAMDPVFHTTGDTADKLSTEEIETVGKLVAQFITEYTGEFSWVPDEPADQEADAYLPAALAAIEERRDLADALAYDEAYSFALEEGVYVTFSGKRLLTGSECAAFFPDIALPEQVSSYGLKGVLVLDGRDMTADAPIIEICKEPPYPLNSVFKLDLRPTAVIAVYENSEKQALWLVLQKDWGDEVYTNPMYEKQVGIAAEGDLYLVLWEGQAVSAIYRRGGMAYTLSFASPDSPRETLEDYQNIHNQSASKEKLMELVNTVGLFSLDFLF